MSRRLLLILGLIGPSVSAQQGRVRLDVTIPANPAVEGPSVSVASVLSDGKTRELVQSGYTTRLTFRLELWRKGRWFDEPGDAVEEWNVLVSYDPAAKSYQVLRQHGKETVHFGGLTSLDSAEALVDEPIKATIHPSRSGRYYYNAALVVEALSVSDLNAAFDWLRGPGKSAVSGKENPGSAFLKGLEVLASRLIGGTQHQQEHASGIFTVP